MKIDMNKDFEEHYKSTWRGLTTAEIVSAVVAFLIGGVFVWGLWSITEIPINVCVYVGIPIMAPILAFGVLKIQGTSMFGFGKEIIYFLRTRKLGFMAEEYDESKIRIFSMKRKGK